MAIRDRSLVQREIDAAQSRLDRLLAELDDAPVIPAEPEKGSVIKFAIQFDPGAPVFVYIAYRFAEHGQRWAVTGPSMPSKYNWKEIVEKMSRDYAVDMGHHPLTFQRVTGWETVSSV